MASTRTAERQRRRLSPDVGVSTGTLTDLPPGARARVTGIIATTPGTAGRLADLGFTPGTVVQVLRRAPLGDPVLYRVKDYEVCLRRAQATCVRVVEVDR
ncbi:hypothetical protein GCM10027280_05640 [Micromonospora polyrhachis]|uniref:Ferrous iron transport protein A n=1 Tax=Micromonospora polyrhachis TaxID=1282883 RepID=A0A7W7SKM2_9ACTN|nr:FeoA family protein [Micromonospora polyrhachis]MBB4956527.1 ferrous iron transport protein A [Micromonospora polyrhachis]